MFWSKARSIYKNVTVDDEDIKKYFEIMDQIQTDGYAGILGWIQDFGHKYVSARTKTGKTIEIGFGGGRQALFYKGSIEDYYPTEVNTKHIKESSWQKFPNATIASAKNLPFEDNFFDNFVSIGVLEHIEDIAKVIEEAKRVLKPDGRFVVALPCEDGLAWNLGRELTTRRIFQKKYNINYDKVIAFEHVHNLLELQEALEKNFKKMEEKYYPFLLPLKDINLIYCATYKLKDKDINENT